MASAEEEQILVNLSEASADIKSHLILIGELQARRGIDDARSRAAAAGARAATVFIPVA